MFHTRAIAWCSLKLRRRLFHRKESRAARIAEIAVLISVIRYATRRKAEKWTWTMIQRVAKAAGDAPRDALIDDSGCVGAGYTMHR